MKLRTLLYLILFALGGYYAYDFTVTQFNQPALAYKRFASAVMDGDMTRGQGQVQGREALNAFSAHQIRQEQLNGTPRFTWYTFLDQTTSPDGNSVTLIVRQSIRVDPPETSSLFGTEVRRDRHVVTLVRDKSNWKVQQFEDTSTQLYNSRRLSQRQ